MSRETFLMEESIGFISDTQGSKLFKKSQWYFEKSDKLGQFSESTDKRVNVPTGTDIFSGFFPSYGA